MANLLEAFPGRLPSEIRAEVERQPVGYLDDVLEARAYMKAKDFYDSAKDKRDLPQGWTMLTRVREIVMSLAQEEIDKRRAIDAVGVTSCKATSNV